MSGRKQHFIPQMILRGFGTATRKSVQVKVNRFGREPFLRLVEEVGAESEFYSAVSDNNLSDTLDDKITEYENELYRNLKYLLEIEDGDVADPFTAAEFVTHLVTRNDHFRRATTAAAQALFANFDDKLGDEDSARRLLGISREKPGRQFQGALSKALDERPELVAQIGLERVQLEDLLRQYAEQNFSEFHADIAEPLKNAFANISGELSQVGATAQRNALGRELVPKLRVEKLSAHTWSISQSRANLILPDCIGIASSRGSMKVPLMLAEDYQTDEIIVPLNKRRLLIGSRCPVPNKLDTNYLNRHFARCSWDFFVSDVDADTRSLKTQIRKNVALIIDHVTTKTFKEMGQ